MRCIYCLEDSSRSRSVPHVAPEALGPHGLVLPVGAVCDACNHYLGHELDSALVAHPVVALFVQFLGIPGKDGRTRTQLGGVRRDIHPNTITIPTSAPVWHVNADGSRGVTVRPLLPREFSLSRFRRALHHVALNTLATQDGVERVLESDFDPVRAYIRHPRKGERWTYAQYVNLGQGLAPDLLLYLARHETSEIVSMLIGKAAAFAVDLLQTGELAKWAEKDLPPGHEIVGADVDPPRESRNRPATQYRLSIDLSD